MSGNLKRVREMSGMLSCHGKVSQNCSYTNMHSFNANTLNNNTIYLTFTQEVLATVSLAFPSKTVIINYEIIVNLIKSDHLH